MNTTPENKSSNSFPILGLLGLLFITLKLCNVLDWSWWFVLAPFWLPVGIILAVFVLGLVFSVISSYKK